MVVDDNGLVQWRNLPAAATPNCDWDLNSGGLLLATSWRNPGTNGNCPDRRWVTGIGTSSPTGKLHVVHNATERAVDSGVKVGYTANSASAGQCFGIQSTVSPSGSVVPSPFGVHSTVTNPSSSGTALFGRVTANGSVTGASSAYGQVGEVRLSSSAVVATSVGSRGYVELASGSTSTEVIGSQGVAAVSNASGSVSNAYGLLGDASVGTGVVTNVFGLKANAGGTGTITNSYGAWTESTNTGAGMQNSFGLRSRGVSGTTSNYGVFALAQGNTNPSNNFGLFAQLTLGTNTSGQNYAGYFQGNMHVAGLASCTNSVWSSDQSLKTDIAELTGAREILLQLRPKNYRFRTEELPYANLPEGLQHGVIAQELEEVMPELVQEIKLAAVLNEEGEELQAARTIKAVNYIGLIPVLIGALQDQQHQLDAQQSAVAQQQATVDELRAQLEDQRQELARAQERLNACCSNPDAGRSLQQGQAAPEELFGADTKLRIQPNPFNERTTVFYSVEKSGRAQLLANSADGKELRVLQEAQLEAGQYQYEWDTTDLAAGMYYVTLLLDGQPVVKKAVKVAR